MMSYTYYLRSGSIKQKGFIQILHKGSKNELFLQTPSRDKKMRVPSGRVSQLWGAHTRPHLRFSYKISPLPKTR